MRQMRQQQRRKIVSDVAHSISVGIADACHVECHHFVLSRLRKTKQRKAPNGDVKKILHSHVEFHQC